MIQEVIKNFMTETDDTGRFIVYSYRTGVRYFVEPIDNRERTDWTNWGSIDPSTGTLVNKPGFRKYHGAINEKDSLITEENGFTQIKMCEPGLSPHAWIEWKDAKYPTLIRDLEVA